MLQDALIVLPVESDQVEAEPERLQVEDTVSPVELSDVPEENDPESVEPLETDPVEVVPLAVSSAKDGDTTKAAASSERAMNERYFIEMC